MARYYLHLRHGPGPDDLAIDQEGDEIADAQDLRAHVLAVARDLAGRTRLTMVRNWYACAFEVTDARGRPVMTVPFSDLAPDGNGG